MSDKSKGPTTSLWQDTARLPEYSALKQDLKVDVCIVGGGIAGLTAAYLLAREGRSVAVLESRALASGQTPCTTAHLSNAIDDRFIEIERIHGEQGARLAAESHTSAIDTIEEITEREGIECDFRRLPGYLFVPPDESTDILDEELAAAHRAGLVEVEIVGRAPLTSFDTGRALRFPRQGQFHPLKYLAGLANAFTKLGGKIFTQTHVKRIDGGEPARIATQNGPTVSAEAVIVATNSPINDLVAIHTKQAPYISYAIAARIPRGSITPALYWDTLDAYHYLRTQPYTDESDLLIIGGEDHKIAHANDADERWQRLEQWGRHRFPMLGEVEYRWSGMVMETTDGLAFIGRNPMDKENVFIATGDSGMGMTHGTIAGLLLTDLIQGRENPWSEIYDPSRKPVWGMAWREYLKENLDVAKEYARDWLSGGDVSSADEISAGEGAVLRRGLHKIAAYRDERGELHECSAVCTHLNCIVHWNHGESCWDCPCHGSRFDPYGEVLNGPASAPLSRVEEHSTAHAAK